MRNTRVIRLALIPVFVIVFIAIQNGVPATVCYPVQPDGEIDIKVMAYNIHHCNPPSAPGVIDVDAIVDVIAKADPDIVALQEVDINTGRSGKIDQAALIANKLGKYYAFGKAIDYDGGDYGVAILSRFPISDKKIHRLTTRERTNGEPRVLLAVTVELPNGLKIRFGSTHLDAQREHTNRRLQVDDLNEISRSEMLPFIIAGDLNATPGSEIINAFDQEYIRTCDDCPGTVPVDNPSRVIDYIAYSKRSPFQVKEHRVIAETYASDHLPVFSVLTLKPKNHEK